VPSVRPIRNRQVSGSSPLVGSSFQALTTAFTAPSIHCDVDCDVSFAGRWRRAPDRESGAGSASPFLHRFAPSPSSPSPSFRFPRISLCQTHVEHSRVREKTANPPPDVPPETASPPSFDDRSSPSHTEITTLRFFPHIKADAERLQLEAEGRRDIRAALQAIRERVATRMFFTM